MTQQEIEPQASCTQGIHHTTTPSRWYIQVTRYPTCILLLSSLCCTCMLQRRSRLVTVATIRSQEAPRGVCTAGIHGVTSHLPTLTAGSLAPIACHRCSRARLVLYGTLLLSKWKMKQQKNKNKNKKTHTHTSKQMKKCIHANNNNKKRRKINECINRGFPTRMEYLHPISCLRYTILVGNPQNTE